MNNTIRFKHANSSTPRANTAAEAALAQGAAIDDWITNRLTIPTLDLPDLEGATPEEAARELRYAWVLGDGPAPNMIQLLESRGIHAYGLSHAAAPVGAFSAWHNQRPLVFLARQGTPEQSRYDTARELGHLTMHRDATHLTPVEARKQADQFADEFLTPKTAIQGGLPYNPVTQELLRFRAAFRVPAMTAAHTVHNATMSSEWHHQQLTADLSRHGYRTSEPGGMTQYERSRIFDTLFSPDFPKSTTVNTLARETNTPPDDVHALTLSTELRAIPNHGQATTIPKGCRPTLRLIT